MLWGLRSTAEDAVGRRTGLLPSGEGPGSQPEDPRADAYSIPGNSHLRYTPDIHLIASYTLQLLSHTKLFF